MILKFDEGYVWLLLVSVVTSPFILSILSPDIHDDEVHGFYHPKFLRVYEAFRRNFGEGLEREGASVAVYHHGQLVANLWGGWADSEAGRRWTADTRTVLFSATKAVSALCVAVLVDQGYVSYDSRLVEFWPEYGQHGKENTTVEHVLTHMAGLPALDQPLLLEHIDDFDQVIKNIEQSKPLWEPGTASGYHAVTFGLIIDAIVRKTDPQSRSLATFFQEEIAEQFDLPISIGVSREEAPWVARITQPSLLEYVRDIIKNPKLIGMLGIMYFRFDEIIDRIRSNPSWLKVNFDTMALNDPEIMRVPLGAATGVAGAEPLARMFSKVLTGQIITNTTLGMMIEPTLNSWHLERVTLWPPAKGRGFFYEANPLDSNTFTFGHPGYGGQYIHVDPKNQLVIAYVANGLKTGSGELCGTYRRLWRETYNSIRY